MTDEPDKTDEPDADAIDEPTDAETTQANPIVTDTDDPVDDGPELFLTYVTHSEIGPVRKNNQDSGYASPTMLVVADGMGGAAAGDLASSIAIDFAAKADESHRDDRVRGEDMLEVLAGAVERANSRIAEIVRDDRTLDGMGTTLTGAMFDGHRLGIVHIGDSRAYRLRDGDLEQLTHDHSWVQSLIDDGKLTPEEAAYHPHRSLILKVINGQPNNQPDTRLVGVRPGDRLLLCSDGLCGMADDDQIARGLAEPDLDAALDLLVDAAHDGGGMDNITIVIADVTTDADAATGGARPVGAVVETDVAAFFERARRTRQNRAETRSAASPTDDTDSDADTAAEDADRDTEADRYAPVLPPKNKRRFLRPVLATLGVLVALAGVLTAGYVWSRTQYFVAPAEERVAIYQGLPQDVLGYPLSDVHEVTSTQIDDLPPFFAQSVRDTIVVNSLSEAEATTAQLQSEAERCIQARKDAARAQRPAPGGKPGATPAPVPEPGTEIC